MTTKEIKAWLRSLGHKTVRVTSTLTKHPYLTAWLPCDPYKGGNTMTYSCSPFQSDLRRIALQAIYGKDTYGDSAGNITSYSMAMHAHEWAATKERYESCVTDLAKCA